VRVWKREMVAMRMRSGALLEGKVSNSHRRDEERE
jgi:hypothetical protein